MADFALLESPKLISRKIWVIQKSWNFRTLNEKLLSFSMKLRSWEHCIFVDLIPLLKSRNNIQMVMIIVQRINSLQWVLLMLFKWKIMETNLLCNTIPNFGFEELQFFSTILYQNPRSASTWICLILNFLPKKRQFSLRN